LTAAILQINSLDAQASREFQKNIRLVLADPMEVRESTRQSFVELYYQVKTHPEGKTRFLVVVVKVLQAGSFVSTAMTANSMKSGRTLYRKGDAK
jgi:hypothetical protein